MIDEEGKSTNTRGCCGSCGAEDGRYTCPACKTRSCSVKCVKKHKEVYNCTGKRCATQYVPISQYDDTTLLSENVLRYTDSTSRDKVKQLNYQQWKRTKNMSKLKHVAKARGTTLYLAPVGLSLHQSNTSRVYFDVNMKKQVIMWKIDWNFVQSDIKYVDKCVCEMTVLQKLLDRYIHPVNSDPIIRHKLRQYVKSYDAINVYMKVERSKRKCYYLLDKTLSLLDNLKGKLILEHPIFWITCSTEQNDNFPLIESCTNETSSGSKDVIEVIEEEISIGQEDIEQGGAVEQEQSGLQLISDSYNE